MCNSALLQGLYNKDFLIITLVYKRWESRNECRYFRRSNVAKQFFK